MRLTRAGLGAVGVAALAVGLASGCSTVGYYAQSVRGHLALVGRARPVGDWLGDPATPEALRRRLVLSQQMRDFAVDALKEPDNASYRRYADLGRGAAVWNVVAAPELSLTLSTWCFAVVGCVGYRGYFDRTAADTFAAGLSAQGLEVAVYGVPAYSTLGKLPGSLFADPLLNTFIDDADGDLARLIFHELAHQIAFAPGDTVFNESFATAVETIGGQRWLVEHADERTREADARAAARRADFQALTLRWRDALDRVYKSDVPDSVKRQQKAETLAAMRADYARTKVERWGGYAGYDSWFARANNANFAVLAAYNQLVPNFERLFEREGADFARFYAEVRRIAALPAAERRAALP